MGIAGFGTDQGQAKADLRLIPYPPHVSFKGAPMRPLPSQFLHVAGDAQANTRVRAKIVADQLAACGIRVQVTASTALHGHQALFTSTPTVTKKWEQSCKPLRGLCAKPEGYRLTIASDGALIQGIDEHGFFYAGQTLRQLVEDGQEIPGMEIEDGPLLPFRAIHLDCRGWPPSRTCLERTIDLLASYKINVLVLEYERHFAFNSQPGLSSKDALPPNYLADLDLFALDRGVKLVPLQHCIGNLNYMLRMDPYKDLREDPRYFQMACPSNPATTDIFIAMAEDLIAAHSSQLFHIGGDQARFLGVCPQCKARSKQLGGRASLYLEYIGKLVRYLNSRNRHVMVWDDLFRNMSDQQVSWMPQDSILTFWNYSGHGGRATQAILPTLDRYKQLGRRVWGAASRLPTTKYENFDNIDAWTEAAEMGYLEGLLTTTWTREYALGPLLAPPEVAWPGALYAAERSWGGRKNATREEFLMRFASRFFGIVEPPVQQRIWGVYDLLVRDYPREAREVIHQVLPAARRNRETLEFIDAWCRMGAFNYYLKMFEQACAADYDHLQSGQADPFHAGRLYWRVEDLKSKIAELTQAFRAASGKISPSASCDEYLNSNLAYGIGRLDELAGLLEGYPSPEKEWQQPVKGV
ncbi:MAG: family 20 glycosylhydrolase [Planctomycetota bacterium]|nr:family 20 glycosylhydrolase [Planctomycetota bacterium]